MVLKAGARRQQENHTRMMMRRRRVLATEQAQENMVGRDGAGVKYWFAIEETPNRRNEALIVDLEKSRNWLARAVRACDWQSRLLRATREKQELSLAGAPRQMLFRTPGLEFRHLNPRF